MQFLPQDQICFIQEFNIVYDCSENTTSAKIEYIGQKMLIFRDDNKVASVKFFPRISMDNVIVGSQIFAKRDSENNSKQIYEIMNL
jgi:hypothetical protein